MEFIKGITWGWVGVRGTWKTAEAKESMKKMNGLGINWTTLAFMALQETAHSPHIQYRDEPC